MFLIHGPSAEEIETFLAASRNLDLSYQPIGIARNSPGGYKLDEVRVEIGAGAGIFELAKSVLLDWEMFNTGFTQVFPVHASTDDGSTVAVLVRHLGFWSLNACRVVYQIREEDAGEIRFGFAYGSRTRGARRGDLRGMLSSGNAEGELLASGCLAARGILGQVGVSYRPSLAG